MKKIIALTAIALFPTTLSAQEQTTDIQGAMNIMPASQASAISSFKKIYHSKSRNFELHLSPEEIQTPLNKIVSWPVRIIDLSETFSLEEATITVDGGMPHHGHGLPTSPILTPLAKAGEYRIEGLKFSMPGYWEIALSVTQNGASDKIILGFTIN